MQLNETHDYSAPVGEVFALMSDPARVVEKYAAGGDTDIEITSHDARDDCPRTVITRKVTVDLPGFARKVMQPTNTVVQTDDWSVAASDGSRTCNYTVEVKGVPSRISGTVTLRPSSGGGTTQEVVAEVKVSIPLLGGRLERFAVDSAKTQLRREAEWTATQLG